jgi:serine phosphatase RsbU (regulator of sigma subunit)
LSATSAAPPVTPVPGERRRERVSVTIVLIGLVATALGVTLAVRTDHSNERRLLEVQTNQAATVLGIATNSFQEPMASALDVAASVLPERRRKVFAERFTRNVGPDKLFQSGALWTRDAAGLRRIVAVGGRSRASVTGSVTRGLLRRAYASGTMAVEWVHDGRQTRIVFALADAEAGFAVSTERVLPATRRAPVDTDSGFAGLDYSVYLGESTSEEDLALTDVDPSELPLEGLTKSVSIPFGDNVLTFTTRPREHLGSSLSQQLPWLLGFGIPILTALALVLARQLLRARRRAESDTRTITGLYERVDTLYGEQRELSVRLQNALLPATIPSLPGYEVAAKYVAGAQGIDIGGDWYSVVGVGEDGFAFVVGDVSGHGIDAVAEMARARFTVRAYLVDGDSPQDALEKCSRQFDIALDGHMVTVVAGVGNRRTGELVLASAGHPSPLLVSQDGAAQFVPIRAGRPLGAGADVYEPTAVTMPPGATVLCYTDGLIERRTEDIDAGFARLAQVASGPTSGPLEQFLDHVLENTRAPEHNDDIAMLALRRDAPLS